MRPGQCRGLDPVHDCDDELEPMIVDIDRIGRSSRLGVVTVALDGVTLNGRCWSADYLVEKLLRRFTGDNGIGDLVGVALESITRRVDAPDRYVSCALVHDMRRLVRRGPQVGRPGKAHAIAL